MKNVIYFPTRQRFAFPTATRVPMSVKQTYMVALWAVHYNNVVRRSLVKLPWRNTTRPDMTVTLNLNPVADELTWANE